MGVCCSDASEGKGEGLPNQRRVRGAQGIGVRGQ